MAPTGVELSPPVTKLAIVDQGADVSALDLSDFPQDTVETCLANGTAEENIYSADEDDEEDEDVLLAVKVMLNVTIQGTATTFRCPGVLLTAAARSSITPPQALIGRDRMLDGQAVTYVGSARPNPWNGTAPGNVIFHDL